jgi:two-component system, NtrC family, sensor kinase
MSSFFSNLRPSGWFRPGTRSLKTTLAVYFIPISVLPALLLAGYATTLLEDSTQEGLIRKAQTERDAFSAEVLALEKSLVDGIQSHSTQGRLLRAMKSQDEEELRRVAETFRAKLQVRFYTLNGRFITSRYENDPQVPYISSLGKQNLLRRGFTVNRFVADRGIVTVLRSVLRDRSFTYGILEEEYVLSQPDLLDFKARREVELALLDKDLKPLVASFALQPGQLKNLSQASFRTVFQPKQAPLAVQLGESRYAAFLFDLPSALTREKGTGHYALFLSLTASDSVISKLKLAMIYVTSLLVLIALLLSFIFSRRLVRPIESLVYAMKRVKTGRTEQIPTTDAPYEIEYLVRSFNEMTRNISAAKRTLELKLEELRGANQEIKETQTHLIQSAKMISLGELVAGVAHELNNPIAFIYSNMLHMIEYVKKLKHMIVEYRRSLAGLSAKERERLLGLERDLEIDYILEDMVELTQSCVDGANRTKEIVLGLRTFSRMDESTFKEADLHEGLRNTLKLLSSEFRARITVHEEYGELPLVECNGSQMNQVFMNLISNAAQAIAGKGEIWIRTRREGGFAVVEIEDSGTGMAAETMEKIFDPFFTTKKVGEGTGLGLSIAYGLVQKHQGTIQVESRPGKGSKFVLRLPLRQKAASAVG